MTEETESIWADDRLGRREEAERLERFLVSETRQLIETGFDHAYVLGVDNQYGMGKTWFLDHLRDHLVLSGYPVAMVDAWADDSGNEPLIALMAAVDEALKPYKRREAIANGLAKTMKSVGTILIKGATGFGAKQAGKLFGDDTLKDIGKDLQELAKSAATDGGAEAIKAMGDLANDYAKNAIDSYITRKHSVLEFKKNLRELGETLSETQTRPIFVIIDELDRCRPTYAIKLLEEVKHLFDVKGLIFVIALHGNQLAHSVKAVYGEGFNAKDYLQRFFSLTYRMKEPTFTGVADYYFDRLKLPEQKMFVPCVLGKNHWEKCPPPVVLGTLFGSMDLSLRQAIAILNGIRVFANQWRHHFPFELITVTYLVALQVTGRQDDPEPREIFQDWPQPKKTLACEGMETVNEYRFSPIQLIGKIDQITSSKQRVLVMATGRSEIFDTDQESIGLNSYITNLLEAEARALRSRAVQFQSGPQDEPSVIAQYRDMVRNIAPYLDED